MSEDFAMLRIRDIFEDVSILKDTLPGMFSSNLITDKFTVILAIKSLFLRSQYCDLELESGLFTEFVKRGLEKVGKSPYFSFLAQLYSDFIFSVTYF